MSIMEKIFGDLNTREVKKLEKIADQVLALEEEMASKSDDELREKTAEFKKRLEEGETLDDILPEAFAVCREGSWRSLGMKHFKVQIIGGIVLHQGRISEMKTGEGKTLVATLPAYLNALEGKGVHIVTVNDYLAKRDMEWMGKLYSFLGLTVGCIVHGVKDEERRNAYLADITYGTNNEFGFDYLRDNMVIYKEEMVQRPLNYAIVDEVDSILIDEARTPLIISGAGNESTSMYSTADAFVKKLKKDTDYTIEEKDKQIALTETGVNKCESYFNIDNFSDPDNMEINHHVQQALKARFMMKKDVDYVIRDGEIIIVDEFTGRLMFGRRYNDGLHQAIEAKEGVKVKAESKTLATVTIQNYFRMYQKLAGMTGTAKTEEAEFTDIYNMDVVVIPTNKPIIRVDEKDSVYVTEEAKYNAIVNKIIDVHKTKQPILVGTISIEKSELIANMLRKRGVKDFNILNAKHHEKEAKIIAEAGRLNSITIATNMAGRGTDIILGGNPEFEAKKQMELDEYSEDEISFASSFIPSTDEHLLDCRNKFNEYKNKIEKERKEEQEQVVELGGLYILGTERHESRRIDNQLRGRSGRQGDPGKTKFFLSLEDDLMRIFGGDRLKAFADKLPTDQSEAVESSILTRQIENAQKKVEGNNFSARKYVLQYDNVMNKQREIIYGERKRVLLGENLSKDVENMTSQLVEAIVEPIVLESKYPEEWDFDTLNKKLLDIYPKLDKITYNEDDIIDLTEDKLKEDICVKFKSAYELKEKEVGEENLREIERMILLRVIDNKWMDHIDNMDQLRDGIGLRGLGQQDPAAAYAHEGYSMFTDMTSLIKEDFVKFCYGITTTTSSERQRIFGKTFREGFNDNLINALRNNILNSGIEDTNIQEEIEQQKVQQETFRRDTPKVGRNDPCPCGSGKKYKFCCGK